MKKCYDCPNELTKLKVYKWKYKNINCSTQIGNIWICEKCKEVLLSYSTCLEIERIESQIDNKIKLTTKQPLDIPASSVIL